MQHKELNNLTMFLQFTVANCIREPILCVNANVAHGRIVAGGRQLYRVQSETSLTLDFVV